MDQNPTAPQGFVTIEHTADVGLRIWGRSAQELFEQGGRGLTDFFVDVGTVLPKELRRICVEAGDLEEVFVAWLQELIYLYEVERFVSAEILVEEATNDRAIAVIRGERLDPDRHDVRGEIKAATHHNLEIHRTDEGEADERWECTVIFDT